jgi:CcmD family protein
MTNFLTENSIYLVLLIALIIWLGLSFYMVVIDRKISKLEQDFINFKEEKQ